jgi:tetratricopeptide (TPR) repeat protein
MTDDQAWETAILHHNAGRLTKAETLYRKILRSAPNHPEAYHNLALIAVDKGDYGISLALSNYALKLNPNFVQAHNTLGTTLMTLGRDEAAVECFHRVLEIDPDHAASHYDLGNALHRLGRNEEAEASYRRSLELDPDNPNTLNNLGNALRSQDRPEDALESYRRAVELKPDFTFAHNNVGNVLRDLDRDDEAEASYRKALEISPDYPDAYYNLGTLLREQGRMEDSEASLRQAIKLKPDYGDAHRHLALTIRAKPGHPDIRRMQNLYADPAVANEERMYIAFGLGKLFDELGDYDKAFAYFAEGNKIKRSTFVYHVKHDVADVDRIIELFDSGFISARLVSGYPDETPLFVVGMLRSGTTLLEQMMASHPDITGGGELMFIQSLTNRERANSEDKFPAHVKNFDPDVWHRLGQAYVERLRDRFPASTRFITDKLPQNFLYIGVIACALPNARIINLQRDPMDVCLSNYFQLFVSGQQYAYDLHELGTYYCLYKKIMEHWAGAMPGKVLDVRYRDLVEDPERSVRAVLDFCDLPFDEACLQFHKTKRPIKTASAGQVRKELYRSSLERWRNYATHLAPLKAALTRCGA